MMIGREDEPIFSSEFCEGSDNRKEAVPKTICYCKKICFYTTFCLCASFLKRSLQLPYNPEIISKNSIFKWIEGSAIALGEACQLWPRLSLGTSQVASNLSALQYIIQLTSSLMSGNQDYGIFSLKYIAASFFATYFAGVVHPLDLIKTRFQSHDGKGSDNLVPKYSSINNAFKVIYKNEGLKGLYKGFYISLLCQATSMSVFFWHYETRKSRFERAGYETMNAVTRASVEASILCTLVTQPIWVVKTRMLLNTNSRISEYQNFKRQVKEIYSHYGLRGALRGLELSLLLSFTGVIQMYVYEGSKLLYEKLRLPESPLGEKPFVCGALSKIFSVFLSYPITTLRTRIQQCQFISCTSSQKYKSLRDLAGRTWREQGVRGLYKGMSANLLKGISQKGIYFYFYEIFKDCLFPRLQTSKVY